MTANVFMSSVSQSYFKTAHNPANILIRKMFLLNKKEIKNYEQLMQCFSLETLN